MNLSVSLNAIRQRSHQREKTDHSASSSATQFTCIDHKQGICTLASYNDIITLLECARVYEGNIMRYTTNLTETPSNIYEIFNLIEGKIIKKAADVGNEFQLHLSDDYMLRISGTEVNLVIPKNPPEK